MKKVESTSKDDLRPEYRREDLGKGVRGKYYEEYTKALRSIMPDDVGKHAEDLLRRNQ